MHDELIVYSDGGARGNPGPAAIGVVICDKRDEILEEHQEYIGETTNNVAEYTAVIVALEIAQKIGAKHIRFFSDSELVMRQLSGQYKIKTPHMLTLYKKVKDKEKSFQKIVYQQVPRNHEKIRRADKLVNLALDDEAERK